MTVTKSVWDEVVMGHFGVSFDGGNIFHYVNLVGEVPLDNVVSYASAGLRDVDKSFAYPRNIYDVEEFFPDKVVLKLKAG